MAEAVRAFGSHDFIVIGSGSAGGVLANRPILGIVTGAKVMRITFEGQRVSGVAFRRRGASCHAVAGAETNLSAGAIGCRCADVPR